MFIYLCIYFYIFLNSFLVFFEDHIGNKCAIVCFNVSILGKYYIYMYYKVLPNKLTHSLTLSLTQRHHEVDLQMDNWWLNVSYNNSDYHSTGGVRIPKYIPINIAADMTTPAKHFII